MNEKKMKRCPGWVRLCIFIALTAIALYLCSLWLDPVRLGYPNLTTERDRYVLSLLSEPEDTVDIVVLGDSESLVLMDTKQMTDQGTSSYIAGQAGQHISESYAVLEKVMEKQHPKVVVLETHVLVSQGGLHGRISNIKNTLETRARELFPVLAYHHVIYPMLGEEPGWNAHERGFEARWVVAPYSGGAYMEDTGEAAFTVLLTQQYYLKKMIRLCEENGAQLVLAAAVSPVNYSYVLCRAVDDCAKKYSLPLVDFNVISGEIGIDWEADMLDGGDHVNNAGTQKMTQYLMTWLQPWLEEQDG